MRFTILNRLGFLRAAAALVTLMPAVAVAEPTQVSIASMAFGPHAVTVHVGDSVVWTNNDGFPHTVTFKDHSAGSKSLARGQTFTRVFDQAGSFEYFCSIHPSMTARVVVTAQ